MNNEELQGRLNGLSMAVEVALHEVYKLKLGESKKAVDVISSELDGLINGFKSTLPDSDFRTGSIEGLQLIKTRLEGIFSH